MSNWLFNAPPDSRFDEWLQPIVSPSFASLSPFSSLAPNGMLDVFLSTWGRFVNPVYAWLQKPTLNGAADGIASMIGMIAIWSLVGGLLCRRSVLELGCNITATWSDSFKLVLQRWQSIAWSLTMPSGLLLIIAIGPLVLGWISNIPVVGLWIAGLLLVPTLVFGIALGWCGAITALGFPLSVCAIVTEKQADAYDGISRSAAYTFQRPLTLALCILGIQFLGAIGGTLLTLVLTIGTSLIQAAFDIGSYTDLENMQTIWGPVLRGMAPTLLTAYAFSLFWTGSSASYLLLRRDVDHAEFDMIDMNVLTEAKPLPSLPAKEQQL
jgi:hypothetical protein